MKAQIIYCLPLYFFVLIGLILLVKSLYPVICLACKDINFRRIGRIVLTSYLILAVIYVIIVSFI